MQFWWEEEGTTKYWLVYLLTSGPLCPQAYCHNLLCVQFSVIWKGCSFWGSLSLILWQTVFSARWLTLEVWPSWDMPSGFNCFCLWISVFKLPKQAAVHFYVHLLFVLRAFLVALGNDLGRTLISQLISTGIFIFYFQPVCRLDTALMFLCLSNTHIKNCRPVDVIFCCDAFCRLYVHCKVTPEHFYCFFSE